MSTCRDAANGEVTRISREFRYSVRGENFSSCRQYIGVLLVAAMLVSATGCTPVTVEDGVVDGNRDEGLTSALGKTYGEPNNGFNSSVVAVFGADNRATLQGTVSRNGDLDVYLLGDLTAGDELLIEASTPGSGLDVSIAVFDGAGRLLANNDDITDNNLDARIEWIVRRDGSRYYLVVTNSPFAASRSRTGTYSVDIENLGATEVPEPIAQTIVLDFNGGFVDAPLLGTMNIVAFDAGDISPVYEGDTQDMKEGIREVFAQNYERFNVTVLTSDDPTPDRPFASIFFGGFDEDAYGIAEDVDLYNINRCDDALIFPESFTLDQFSDIPSVSEMSIAIGNVAAHEAGHLLGLNHVSSEADIMDDRSPADAFLTDQEFRNSPLSSDIMSIGTQDSVLLLTDIVGLVNQE